MGKVAIDGNFQWHSMAILTQPRGYFDITREYTSRNGGFRGICDWPTAANDSNLTGCGWRAIESPKVSDKWSLQVVFAIYSDLDYLDFGLYNVI